MVDIWHFYPKYFLNFYTFWREEIFLGLFGCMELKNKTLVRTMVYWRLWGQFMNSWQMSIWNFWTCNHSLHVSPVFASQNWIHLESPAQIQFLEGIFFHVQFRKCHAFCSSWQPSPRVHDEVEATKSKEFVDLTQWSNSIFGNDAFWKRNYTLDQSVEKGSKEYNELKFHCTFFTCASKCW